MVPNIQARRTGLPRIEPVSVGRQIRNSRRWKAARLNHRRANPVCEACGLNLADEVHHRVPVSRAPHLAFEPSNLMALCHSCHCEVHGKQSRGSVHLPLPVTRPPTPADLDPIGEEGRRRAAQLIG